MSGKHSKQKGSSFERKVGKEFTDWSGYQWRRSFGSGNSRYAARSLNEHCDLVCEVETEFIIECKHHADISYEKMLSGDCSKLNEWIVSLRDDMKRSNKHGLLVLKTNNKLPYVLFIRKPRRKETVYENQVSQMDSFLKYRCHYVIPLKRFFQIFKFDNFCQPST